jgi:flavin reductase (DIM6/NTAB) family NADH-FMN oxidoreductase RutF/DNA-binding MarR family transcriptional regulator
MTINVKDFRRALSQFPTGVTVITTVDSDGKPIGVTASSFNSVSVNPALVLWSIDKSAFSLESFEKSEYFAVNVLSQDQVSTSNRFAGRGEDKFNGVIYNQGAGACPLFKGSVAQFECKTWAVYEGGDHLILVGEVIKYEFDDAKSPLVFSRGSYAISAVHPDMSQTSSLENELGVGVFVEDHVPYLLRKAYNACSQDLYPDLKKECGVNPEQWRVLACLSGNSKLSIKDLAVLVMQPENTLSETLDWMTEKGYMKISDENLISLTVIGESLAAQLVRLAKQHEEQTLSSLSEGQALALKEGLRSILDLSYS